MKRQKIKGKIKGSVEDGFGDDILPIMDLFDKDMQALEKILEELPDKFVLKQWIKALKLSGRFCTLSEQDAKEMLEDLVNARVFLQAGKTYYRIESADKKEKRL